jgi:hypothetical protein
MVENFHDIPELKQVAEKAPYITGERVIKEGPKTFEEMLDTNVGNFLQRAAKAYIKPVNPEQTIKLMRALQVDYFQDVAIDVFQLYKKVMLPNRRIQTTYTLGDNSLNSMVDFATNQTALNEAFHLVVEGLCVISILPAVAAGHVDGSLAFNTVALLVNTYGILAQRYTRTRLSRTIDHALKRHKEFNVDKYTNVLGIKVPDRNSPDS